VGFQGVMWRSLKKAGYTHRELRPSCQRIRLDEEARGFHVRDSVVPVEKIEITRRQPWAGMRSLGQKRQ
jgi:hypothetical protein